jgi:hypothetical protein
MARLPLPAALVCSLAILAAIPALSAEPEKPKTPEKAEVAPEVQKAQELFESLYGEQLRRLAPRDTAGQVAMAAKLLEAAKAAQDQPALLVLMCEKACELGAADPKGYETGVAAADILASNLPDKAAACQERVAMIRQRQYEKARGEERAKAGETLIESLMAVAASKGWAGDIDEAIKRCRQAQVVARAIKSMKAQEIDARFKHLVERQKVMTTLPQLKDQLKADPQDRAAREQLVRLLLVECDNPVEAVKYVDGTCDEKTRKFVPAAAKGLEAAPEQACAEMAEWYRGLASGASPGGQAAALTRAKAYSERYLALHAERDISRTKVELGVKQIEDDLKHLGGEAWAPANETFGPGHWIDILKLVDPNMDMTDSWERKGNTLVSSGGGVVAFPVVPAGNYEVELKFVHGDGDIRIWPPLGTGRAYLTLPGEGKGVRCGMDGVKGGWYVGNETTVKGPDLERDRAHTVLLQVQLSGDQAAFGVTIDGASLIKWTGAQSALRLPGGLVPPPKEKCVCLAKPGGGKIVVQGVRLRMLTGRANPLRPPAPTPAATAPGAAGESPAPARPETK